MSLYSKIFLTGLILLACAGCLGKTAPVAAEPPGVLSPRIADQDVTPLATPTDLPPTPTETLPPTPKLPAPESLAPDIQPWVGALTYAAAPQPGYYFRVDYDASLWALTEDETGIPALIHRKIPYCKIVPTGGGRGTPRGWTSDDQFRDVGPIRYEVVTVSQNNVVQFVNYFGSNGVVRTGFQVSFQEQKDMCIQAAETILATLSSVAAPTPTPTPVETPTLTASPAQ